MIGTELRISADDISAVRDEIEFAFDSLDPPDFGELLSSFRLDDEDGSLIFQELNGRRWEDLDAAFLAGRWSYFGQLNAEGYRYYLPALLLRCLDDFSHENPLVHSTLFMLRPSYWRLYRYGKDKKATYQASLFSEAQSRAVCSFLGLASELGPSYRHLGFSALYWRWNQYDHPAVVQSRAYYEGCHNYSYPDAQEPTIAALMQRVETAFASYPYPGDDRICSPQPGDEEPAEYAMEFRGAQWQRLNPGFLAQHYPSLSFFTHDAFRYFLPAYLVADLMAEQLQLWLSADPVFHLTHGLVRVKTMSDDQIARFIEESQVADPELELTPEMLKPVGDAEFWHARALERFAGFDHAQRKAIVTYLQHMAAQDEYQRADIDSALKDYWLPSLE